MSLAETFASLEESRESLELSQVIGSFGLDPQTEAKLRNYCTGDRLPRTGHAAIQGEGVAFTPEPPTPHVRIAVMERSAG